MLRGFLPHLGRHVDDDGDAHDIQQKHLHQSGCQEDQDMVPSQAHQEAHTKCAEQHRDRGSHAAAGLRYTEGQKPGVQDKPVGPDRQFEAVQQPLRALHRQPLHPELETAEHLSGQRMHPVQQDERNDEIALVAPRQRPAQTGVEHKEQAQPLEQVNGENHADDRQQRATNTAEQRRERRQECLCLIGGRRKARTHKNQYGENGDERDANRRIVIARQPPHVGECPHGKQ